METKWNDFKNVGSSTAFTFGILPELYFNGVALNAVANFAIGTNTKYLSWHIPNNNLFIESCKKAIECSLYYIEKASNDVQLQWEGGNSKNLIFTKQVYILGEKILSIEEEMDIKNYGIANDLNIIYRGPQFTLEKESVFISYDSRDREEYVSPLIKALGQRHIPFWYDEYSLKVGDPLRESLEEGIRKSKYCIILLSKNFLSNPGWTKSEFDSIISKEIIESKKVILPININVSSKEIYDYSTILYGRKFITWDKGIEETCNKITTKILNISK